MRMLQGSEMFTDVLGEVRLYVQKVKDTSNLTI